MTDEGRRHTTSGTPADQVAADPCVPPRPDAPAEGPGYDVTGSGSDAKLLSESKARYQALIESTSDFVWEVDAQGRYTYCSPQVSTLWDLSPEAMIGKTPFDLMPPEQGAALARMFQDIAQNPGPFAIETTSLDGHGDLIHLEVRGVPFFDEQAVLLGFRGISRDITQRVQSDAAFRESLEKLQRAIEREETLKRITAIASALLPPDELASRIAEAVANLIGAKHAHLRLVSEDGKVLLGSGAYDPDGFLQRYGDMPVDADTETAIAFRSSEMRVGEDIGPSVTDRSKRNAAKAGVGSYLLVPVTVGDKTIGVYYMGWTEPRKFSEEELSFIRAVTAQFSVGLQNARLYASERRRRHRIEALHDILEVGVGSLDMHEAAQRAIERLSQHYEIDLGSVWIHRGDALERVAGVGDPGEYLTSIELSEPYDAVSAFVSGKRRIVRKPEAEDVFNVYKQVGIALSVYAAMPLKAHRRTIGVLVLAWRGPQELNEHDVAFFDSAADEIAVVLENSRLYQVEHNIAETLQETLVALPSHLPGLSFSRAYESATVELGRVGGDFVDLFQVQEHKVGIVIGDVSGKGMDAAVITSLVRNTVRAHAIEDLSAESVCQKTNSVLLKFSEQTTFVTMFFGLLDTSSGVLRYVACGHPPGLILSDGEVGEELPGMNPILGAFPRARFHESQNMLRRGDRLLLYTDGVTEARSPKGRDFYHLTGLQVAAQKNARTPTPKLAGALMHDVLQFTGRVLRDDAAILVVEATALDDAGESRKHASRGRAE